MASRTTCGEYTANKLLSTMKTVPNNKCHRYLAKYGFSFSSDRMAGCRNVLLLRRLSRKWTQRIDVGQK